MRKTHCIRAECPTPVTPEFLRVLSIANHKERVRRQKLLAGRRALSAANKLKNPAQKKFHQSRIFSMMNKLRAGV